MTSVVVHVPYELHRDADMAPQIRPRRMIEAFGALGSNVIVVAGTPRQRRLIMRRVLRDIAEGSLRVDLVYSESAGWPNAVSDGRKGSFHPYLDESFLRAMHRLGIPVGLFYRDAYHRSEEFYQVSRWKRPLRVALRLMAERDLRRYSRYVSILYLPSLEMRRQLPEYSSSVAALPPGASVANTGTQARSTSVTPLRLLYVGGLGSLYKIHELLDAVKKTRDVELTICTREGDWASVENEYHGLLSPCVTVVHEFGAGLAELYTRADIAVLTVEPHPYREFAVPVKLFEYIGSGIPILATAGTYAGQYVSDADLGWALTYSADDIASTLSHLGSAHGREEVAEAAARVRAHAPAVTWAARARRVLDDLSGAS